MAKSGYYLICITLLIFSLLFWSACVYDERNPEYCIKMKNMSDKEIIVYLKDTYTDTTLNEDDEAMLHHGLTTRYFTDGSSFGVNDSDVIEATKEYCDREIWKYDVKNDTLLLFIFDRQKLKKTKNLNESKLSMIYVTYDYLMKNNCFIKYTN